MNRKISKEDTQGENRGLAPMGKQGILVRLSLFPDEERICG